MSKGKVTSNVAINFLYNTAYQLLRIILPLITVPYVSRILGAEKLGIYNYTPLLYTSPCLHIWDLRIMEIGS